MNTTDIEIWIVYEKPDRYPDSYVAIKFINQHPTSQIIVKPFLYEIVTELQDQGWYPTSQCDEDDDKIKMVWV